MTLLLIVILICLIILGFLSLIPGYTPSIKDAEGHALQGSIASLEKVNLSGQKQWI